MNFLLILTINIIICMKSLHYFYISFKTQKTYVFQCRTVSNLSYIVFLKTMGVSCSKRAIGLLNPHPYMFYSFSLLNLNYLIIYEYRINRKLVTKNKGIKPYMREPFYKNHICKRNLDNFIEWIYL
jgi:hypothetical protein